MKETYILTEKVKDIVTVNQRASSNKMLICHHARAMLEVFRDCEASFHRDSDCFSRVAVIHNNSSGVCIPMFS